MKHDDLAQLSTECAKALEAWFFKARWNGWKSVEAWQEALLATQKGGDGE